METETFRFKTLESFAFGALIVFELLVDFQSFFIHQRNK